jgi:uncharacterized DUF497 family protein
MLDWDVDNRRHIQRHGLNEELVEQALADPIGFDVDLDVVDGEERITTIGATNDGRLLAVVYSIRGGWIHPVTAYRASSRLRCAYAGG